MVSRIPGQKVAVLLLLAEVVPVQAVAGVVRGVAVHEIHDHDHPHPVGSVNEVLEVLWTTRPRAHRKGVRDVVAEGGVVRVLLDRHQLNGVVVAGLDPGQDLVREFPVGRDLGLLATHSHVALGAEKRGVFGQPRNEIGRTPRRSGVLSALTS